MLDQIGDQFCVAKCILDEFSKTGAERRLLTTPRESVLGLKIDENSAKKPDSRGVVKRHLLLPACESQLLMHFITDFQYQFLTICEFFEI